MSRKDKPYLPLYVQDFMTDEKLAQCSASTTGVYIRFMCVLHKSRPYGKFSLKEKDKSDDDIVMNFAKKLRKLLPYELGVVLDALNELIAEDIVQIDGDYLLQKRMVNDGKLSEKRSKSGRKGGEASHRSKNESDDDNIEKLGDDFAQANVLPNVLPNSEIEIESEIDNESDYKNTDKYLIAEQTKKEMEKHIIPNMMNMFKSKRKGYPFVKENDYFALHTIIQFICNQKKIIYGTGNNKAHDKIILDSWEKINNYLPEDNFYHDKNLAIISRGMQIITQKMMTARKEFKPVTTGLSLREIKDQKLINYED